MCRTCQIIMFGLLLTLCSGCTLSKVSSNLSTVNLPVLLGPINRIGGTADEPINGTVFKSVVEREFFGASAVSVQNGTHIKTYGQSHRSENASHGIQNLRLYGPNWRVKASLMQVSVTAHISCIALAEASIKIYADVWDNSSY